MNTDRAERRESSRQNPSQLYGNLPIGFPTDSVSDSRADGSWGPACGGWLLFWWWITLAPIRMGNKARGNACAPHKTALVNNLIEQFNLCFWFNWSRPQNPSREAARRRKRNRERNKSEKFLCRAFVCVLASPSPSSGRPFSHWKTARNRKPAHTKPKTAVGRKSGFGPLFFWSFSFVGFPFPSWSWWMC